MNIPNDPVILLSFVNTKLRDFYKSFDDMCDDMDIDGNDITNKLNAIGYKYDEARNAFV